MPNKSPIGTIHPFILSITIGTHYPGYPLTVHFQTENMSVQIPETIAHHRTKGIWIPRLWGRVDPTFSSRFDQL